MAKYIPSKELEELKPRIANVTHKVMGYSDPSLVTVIMNSITSGHNKSKMTEKLSVLLDPERGAKLSDRVHEILVCMSKNSLNKIMQSKRSQEPEPEPEHVEEKEKRKKLKDISSTTTTTATSMTLASKLNNPLSPNQIKDMMANAQKLIEERKRALNLKKVDTIGVGGKSALAVATAAATAAAAAVEAEDNDKQKKIQQLQAQIQSKIATGLLKTFPPPPPPPAASPLISTNSNSNPKSATVVDKPTPLILDSEGRTVDVTGKEVQLTHVSPTLKANIRARKRETFGGQHVDNSSSRSVGGFGVGGGGGIGGGGEETAESKFFDTRLPIKSSIRAKRALKFHEPGKFQQLADRMRMKAQLEKLQNEISQIARKTGISSAAKLAQLAPKGEEQIDEIPDMEWWDSVIINDNSYTKVVNENCVHLIHEQAITHLVEHPIQMKPPSDPTKPIFTPIFLTKEERKKLRRQNRREAWKEEQEKIRLGLTAPPEPKLRISNLMRVLGTEAIQDPTKMEAHVKAQMAKRQKAHEEANASRKLTAEQKRDKTMRKLKEDTSLGVHVAVFRVEDLSSMSKKFKVETNAKQLFMTGGVVMFQDCNVVVVEGGPKQIKKFKRLMLHRIKWEEDNVKSKSGKEIHNKCSLVWEGTKQQRNFGEMKFKACATEKLARDQLRKHGVAQYWDLAYSKTILDMSDEK